MKILIYIFFFNFHLLVFAQLDANNLMGLPTASTTEIDGITGAVAGQSVYDTDKKSIVFYDGVSWRELLTTPQTLVLNRTINGANIITTSNNSYIDLPVDDSHIIAQSGSSFTVDANGYITINTTGNYLISTALSVRNMPAGEIKYILALFRGNGNNPNLLAYLTRGFNTKNQGGSDYWGASGTVMYPLTAGDVIRVRYVINANGNTLNGQFANIGITKI